MAKLRRVSNRVKLYDTVDEMREDRENLERLRYPNPHPQRIWIRRFYGYAVETGGNRFALVLDFGEGHISAFTWAGALTTPLFTDDPKEQVLWYYRGRR